MNRTIYVVYGKTGSAQEMSGRKNENDTCANIIFSPTCSGVANVESFLSKRRREFNSKSGDFYVVTNNKKEAKKFSDTYSVDGSDWGLNDVKRIAIVKTIKSKFII